MYALIETGGKQFKVSEGDIIFAEKLDVSDGDEVKFDKILAVGEGGELKIGAPYVGGCVVSGKVIKNGKGKKIRIFKYNAKKNYRRTKGHRQPYTKILIESIGNS